MKKELIYKAKKIIITKITSRFTYFPYLEDFVSDVQLYDNEEFKCMNLFNMITSYLNRLFSTNFVMIYSKENEIKKYEKNFQLQNI